MRLAPFIAPFLIVLLAAACSTEPATGTAAVPRPNILFIFSDDHAAHAISAYGSRINETPNIDRLAREGLLFRNCFCGNSICGPSRATILTGLHSHANGFMRNGNRFDGDQTTFPKLLQQAGYQTAMIGKWHLGSDPQGFDHWIVLPGQGQYYNPDFRTADGRVRIEGYCTDITTDLAISWLEEQRDPGKPFVLMCQHKAPHRSWMPGPDELALFADTDIPEPATLFDDYTGRGPAAARQEMEIDRHMYSFYDLKLVPTDEEKKELRGPDRSWRNVLDRMNPEQRAAWDAAYAAGNSAFRSANPQGADMVRWKYQRYIKNYLRCVAGVDKSVGQLLAWLDAHPDVAENTIVVYSSDQGFYLGEHGWYDKRWMYEESLRMPLLIRWPSTIPAGKECDALVQNIDFGPTFLDLAGVPVPESMHGESLVPLFDGDPVEGWRDAIYYHYYESHAVHNVAAHYGVRTHRYKLLRFYEPEYRTDELYDLVEDPDELHNIAADPAHGELLAMMQQRLGRLREQYRDETGELRGDRFDITAGIARAVPKDGGWLVQANTGGGYALSTAIPLSGSVTLRCTVGPAPDVPLARAMVVLTGGRPRARLFRAGIDWRRRRLQILGPDLKERAGVALAGTGMGRVALEIRADLDGHRLVLRAGHQEISADLPVEWQTLSAYGFGSSNGTAWFSEIKTGGE